VFQNYEPKYGYRSATKAQSLPAKLAFKHPSKLSVASSTSPLPWPFPAELKPIVKNVMVNNFGRVSFNANLLDLI
jgi:hypothetical protein